MAGEWWQFVLLGAGTATLVVLMTPVAIQLAKRNGIMDNPGGHKRHDSPVPYLGGVAILLAFLVAALTLFFTNFVTASLQELLVTLSLAVALSITGLLDDLRNLPSLLRLVLEVAAAVVLWNQDVRVNVGGASLFSLVLTVIWVVGITNAFNLLDNMDGLSAGLAALAAGGFFVISLMNDQTLVAALAIALVGCATGFLVFNFYPANIYMGDAGALFLGFMVAFLGLKIQVETSRFGSFAVPVAVTGMAILDTSLVTFSRLAHRISPFQGGRDHLSHRIVTIGIPVPVAVGAIYFGGATVATVGVVMARVDTASAAILFGLLAVGVVGLGVLAALVPVYPSSLRRRFEFRDVGLQER